MPFLVSIGARKVHDGSKNPKLLGAYVVDRVQREGGVDYAPHPAFTSSNYLIPSAMEWEHFSMVTGLKGVIPPYGTTSVNKGLIETVEKAKTKIKPQHPECYHRYVEWLVDWMRWALAECRQPVIIIR